MQGEIDWREALDLALRVGSARGIFESDRTTQQIGPGPRIGGRNRDILLKKRLRRGKVSLFDKYSRYAEHSFFVVRVEFQRLAKSFFCCLTVALLILGRAGRVRREAGIRGSQRNDSERCYCQEVH